MSFDPVLPPFEPRSPDGGGVITWVHLGDLHMTSAGEQNHRDLLALIDEINGVFAASISFVYLPGDVADQGAAAQYRLVREALDRLAAPWCAILGDHDVHEKSFANFLASMSPATHYAFEVGVVRFLALNAFDIPEPPSFTMLPAQLAWLEEQLRQAKGQAMSVVLFLHCYPSDLKQGGDELRRLIERYPVRLIDMGHTHYNEVANDGRVLYTATRSTGQIEEGPVGFSITNLDGDAISWRFFPLNQLPAVMITSPADERLLTVPPAPAGPSIHVRAKAWSAAEIRSATARFLGRNVPLHRMDGSNLWAGEIGREGMADGVYELQVSVVDAEGRSAEDSIRVVLGASAWHPPQRAPRDQDNALPAWPERGLLGTQLGPNKNGRKW